MKFDKEYLKMFLELIDKIDHDNGNTWFSSHLCKTLSDRNADISSVRVNDIYDDLKRTKYFLKHIDKSAWLEGFRYYDKVKIPDLKIELIKDFKEMRIADQGNDIFEFTRRLVMQIENCYNYILDEIDAYTIIRQDSNRFINNYNNLLTGNFSFFQNDGTKKDLKDIQFPSKAFFMKQFFALNYNPKLLSEMQTIRNKASHRGKLSSKDQSIMDECADQPTQKKTEYFNVFNAIIKNLPILYN